MRYLTLALLFVLISNVIIGQRVPRSPNSKENPRADDGYYFPATIDSKTPLDTLIKTLEGPWRFKETGKAYWFGYTDEMYSIAAYKDSAIKPLMEFYANTKVDNGKAGAIFCLHLIGIESKIIGRFIEKFSNKNAREALLQLTNDSTYLWLIVTLLARDPWKSDLPVLSELLKKSSNLELINALFRYTYKDFPFREYLSESLDTIGVYLKDSIGVFKIGYLETIYREKREDDIYKGNSLVSDNNVIIQTDSETRRIFRRLVPNQSELKRIQTYFPCGQAQLNEGKCEAINDLLYDLIMLSRDKVSVFSYSGSDDAFHHYIDKGNIIICTAQESRLRWLEYFKRKKP